MCGFAGVVAWDERYRVSREMLQKMSQSVAHRGPDGQDLWINHEQREEPQSPQCALAFRRLAILDPQPRSMQPMSDGRRWIVFNGEIYNFRELRAELQRQSPDRPWKTSGDTEVLLRCFEAWGEACLEKLNGMFALAVWDQETNELTLARDRMGQKPLFVAVSPDRGAIAFASELPALRYLNWPDLSIDSAAIGQYLRFGYIAAPATVYRGIAKLPAAYSMVCKPGRTPTTRVYFDPNQPGDSPAAQCDLKSQILDSVRRQMVADVPLGCFLSGGADSSVIAAAMKSAAQPGQRVLTFSIGFDDERYDETHYAQAVAAHLGTEHRAFVVRPDAAADLPRLAEVFGEPFGDSSALPTHYLARETVGHVKVALSGDGGDELFGGYGRYRAMRWGPILGLMPRFLGRWAAALPGNHPKSYPVRIKRLLKSAGCTPAERYARFVELFDTESIHGLDSRLMVRDLVAETVQRLSPGREPVLAAMATDRITYLPDDLLAKVDRASMLHGLEVRSPFLDHDLVHAAAKLTTREIFNGGAKRALRLAFAAQLPDFVFRRRKMGFAVPIGDWLRTSLRPMLYDLLGSADSFAAAHFDGAALQQFLLEHQKGLADHSQRLYGLLMLELWWRQNRR